MFIRGLLERLYKKGTIKAQLHCVNYKYRRRLVCSAWIQGDVDGGEGLYGPAGVGVARGEHPPHERPDELREAALDDALSDGAHQAELQNDTTTRT